jgi:hypothetical protein
MMRAASRVQQLFALVLFAHPASGQTKRVVVDTARVCSACRLTFDSIATIELIDRDGRPQRIQDVIAPAVGRFVVLSRNLPMPVFSSAGRLIDSTGWDGGVMRAPPFAQAVGPRGDLFFFADSRAFVFDSSGRFRRSMTLRNNLRKPVILSDGKIAGLLPLIMSSSTSKGSVMDLPLFRLHDTTGAELRGIGSAAVDADAVLFAGKGGTMWTARFAPYELKQWSQTGELLRVVDRPMAGFGGQQFLDGAGATVQPQLIAARQDEAGLLWVVYLRSMRKADCRDVAARCWDSTVDVLDPDTGELIATGRIAILASQLLDHGYVSAFLDLSPDRRVAVIYRGRLTHPGR